MSGFRLSPSAYAQIEDIHIYTAQTWGDAQADEYVEGLFKLFEGLVSGEVHSRELAKELGVEGRISRYGSHFVIWRKGSDGAVLIAAILHVKMDFSKSLRAIFSL